MKLSFFEFLYKNDSKNLRYNLNPFQKVCPYLKKFYKNFELNKFKSDIKLKIQSAVNYETFEKKFLEVLNSLLFS